MFVNRHREIESLEARFSSEQAELYVLYGRRRIGKTELLHAFCQGKRHIFFVADLGTEGSLLAEFTRLISVYSQGEPSVPNFGSLLSVLVPFRRSLSFGA